MIKYILLIPPTSKPPICPIINYQFSIPNSPDASVASLPPNSAFCIHNSAFLIPHSSFLIPHS